MTHQEEPMVVEVEVPPGGQLYRVELDDQGESEVPWLRGLAVWHIEPEPPEALREAVCDAAIDRAILLRGEVPDVD